MNGHRSRRTAWAIVLAYSAMACGGQAEPQSPGLVSRPPVNTLDSRADLAVMLNEVMASEVCDQVRGRFLPIAHTRNGAPAYGHEPVGGRWWVQDCRAQVFGNQTALYLAGSGWAWGEGTKGFWETRDYVYFTAQGTLLGSPDVRFDAARRVVSFQFRPSAVPFINADVTSRLEAHGDLLGKTISVFTLGLLNDTFDDKANEQALQIVRAAFARQMNGGFAIEFDLARRQRSLVSLAPPMPPVRPYADGVRWVVNEQQILHRRPGAVHVNGPFGPTYGAGVDIVAVSGSLRYRVECERDVLAWFEPISRGTAAVLPPPSHSQAGVVFAGAPLRRTLAAACPWYLITEPNADDVVANVRVRADTSGYPTAGP